jgi:hypothetical protein
MELTEHRGLRAPPDHLARRACKAFKAISGHRAFKVNRNELKCQIALKFVNIQTLYSIAGETGDAGLNGKDGLNGLNGKDGAAGPPGPIGKLITVKGINTKLND